MKLSELQEKNIVTTEGKYVGNIIDISIKNGTIEYLIAEKAKFIVSMFTTKDEFKIKWEDIKTIGEDVIIVNNI